MLRMTGQAALFAGLMPRLCRGAISPALSPGTVIAADPTAAEVGNRILAVGGNAIDATVAAAFAACVTAAKSCGPGGYGGHATIAIAREKKISSLDFNTVAPAAVRPDMFPVDKKGRVVNDLNSTGWLASAVPGTLAGLQMAVDHYGTRPLAELMAPAIALAREGFPVTADMARTIETSAPQLKKFPGSLKVFFKPDGEPYQQGELYRNPDLASLLETLAKRNSVDSFYRGDIALRIAEAFQKNGGLVTAADLANYSALDVTPLKQEWNGFEIYTAPLTAGGLSVLEAINFLKAMGWSREKSGTARTHRMLEALRLAWRDRLAHLGDPAKVDVPVKRLLSWDYALESAKLIEKAVHDQHPLDLQPPAIAHNGTMNISAVDGHGNMIAITLTHGNAFGSSVTIEGLGLTLGHGMSRFEPVPGKPNSIAPGKRPLDNMCPSILTRHSKPVMALGGAGGRHIPNCIYGILCSFAGLHETMQTAMRRPRFSTQGDLDVLVEDTWPDDDFNYLKSIGYNITKAQKGASLVRAEAVTFDSSTGECAGLLR
jgi:gamma-glutamyltranspeptidase/glutathione hydrolase